MRVLALVPGVEISKGYRYGVTRIYGLLSGKRQLQTGASIFSRYLRRLSRFANGADDIFHSRTYRGCIVCGSIRPHQYRMTDHAIRSARYARRRRTFLGGEHRAEERS
jgi:hypothetical protein